MQNIYSFNDYVDFLKWKIEMNSSERRYKSNLAEAAGCQPSFLSQVLGDSMDLTADHAMGLCEFWGLNTIEKEYFITLVQLARASSHALKGFYKKKLELVKKQNDKLTERFQVDSFADEPMKAAIYYSHWLNTAVHLLVGTKNYNTVEAVAKYFSISAEQVASVLNRLRSIGFVENKNDIWTRTKNNIHVSKDSSFYNMYHQQWRQRSMDSMDRDRNAVNYTSLYTLSKEDQHLLKNMIVDFIEKTRGVVIKSEEEKLMCFTLDFFEVK